MSTIVFDILARDRASDKFDKIGDSASKSSGKLKKFAMVGGAAVGAAAVVAGKALWDMGKAAAEDEKSQAMLSKALELNAGATKKQVAAVEDWITAQGKQLGVADDELRPALSKLVTATKDVGKAQELSALALDISAGTGKNYTSVVDSLVRAQNGSIDGLSRLGIATKDAEGKTKSMDQVTKDLAKTFGGQAAAAADTTQGKFSRLKLQFDEVKESIGQKLLPMAEKFAGWLLRDGIPAAERFAKVAGPVLEKTFEVIGDGFREAARAGKWMWDEVLQPTFSTMLKVLRNVASTGAEMLDALSKAPGMGWAKEAAEKLRNVADQADAARRKINGIPTYKNVQVSINFLYPKGKPTKNIEDTDDWLNDLGSRGRIAGRGRSSMTPAQAISKFYDALADGVKRGGEKLDGVLVASRDKLREKLSGLRDEMSGMADSIASALDRSDFGGTLEEHLASLTGTNSGLTNLMSVFQNLKAGASKDYLQKVMESGNLGLATALGNDPAALARASALSDANAAMAKSLGADTAQTILGDRITTALADEIKKLIDELKDQPGKTAKKLREEIKELRLVVSGLEAGRAAHLRGAH